jgi:dihydrofolate reductase
MKPLSIIVAVASNGAIGKDNDLLAYLPGDLKRFKELTTEHTILMGRKTWESLPKKPLPKRKNIVITRDLNYIAEGATLVNSIENALVECDPDKENFIIGGGEIYIMLLPVTNKLYLTRVHHNFEADVFLPEINFEEWTLLNREDIAAVGDNPYSFSYETWERK